MYKKNWDSLGRSGFSLGQPLGHSAASLLLKKKSLTIFLLSPECHTFNLARNSRLFFFHPLASVQPPLSWPSTPSSSSLIQTGLIKIPGTPCVLTLTCYWACPILCSSPVNSYSSMIQLLVPLLSQIFFDL